MTGLWTGYQAGRKPALVWVTRVTALRHTQGGRQQAEV